MDISANDLWFLGSGAVFGFSCGYAFANILFKKHKKSRKEYKKIIKDLNAQLHQAREDSKEREMIKELQSRLDSKDREIQALQKRLNSFRFTKSI